MELKQARIEAPLAVSAIVMAKNEARNIAECLRSLRSCAEVFVVDSGSSDGTTEIAQSIGANTVLFAWDGRYPKKKQWCLENLPFAYEWVLFVDADERLTASLETEIRRILDAPSHAGYFVEYDYFFVGRLLRHGHRVRKLVLFDRHRGAFSEWDDLDVENMWEVEGHYQPRISGTVGTLHERMEHRDHDTLFHFFERHNRYSDWEASLRESDARLGESLPRGRRWAKVALTRIPFRPMVVFAHSYVLRLGLLDGRAGLDFALARAFYYWQIDLKRREIAAARCGATRL